MILLTDVDTVMINFRCKINLTDLHIQVCVLSVKKNIRFIKHVQRDCLKVQMAYHRVQTSKSPPVGTDTQK